MDWAALRTLRERFLQFDPRGAESANAQPDRTDYWSSVRELASYDLTFAERIGWKWDSVIAELKARNWRPPAGAVLDWGCGTGVAGRRVVNAWPDLPDKLKLWDRSVLARDFAAHRAQNAFPGLEVKQEEADSSLLVISHVLNELSDEELEHLFARIEKAQAVLWVEPGTADVSRKLITVRSRLLGQFRVIAPCTHGQACGMLAAGNERHWCHHFAKIPGSVHRDADWSRFSTSLGIDLGTLPFSFLVLDRRPEEEAGPERESSRVIGRPRGYKGFLKVLSCQSDGVRELVLQKRDAPQLFKEMKKDPASLCRWEREGDRIMGGRRLC